MTSACAIYGYEFTREFTYQGMSFLPRYASVTDANEKARDQTRYHLTGVVVLDKYDGHQIFCLEAVLSFIEHLDVLISDPLPFTDSDVFALFPPVARTAERHTGGGAVLHQDAFFHEIRSNFIELAMSKLADDHFCEETGWRTLFFKATVPFRVRSPYIEVTYFLLFSGLETYVRRTLHASDHEKAAPLISKRLRQLKFEIYNYRPNDLKRSADTYVRLRNALFHNSSLQTTRKNPDKTVVNYKLEDYIANFRILVSLVVVRG